MRMPPVAGQSHGSALAGFAVGLAADGFGGYTSMTL